MGNRKQAEPSPETGEEVIHFVDGVVRANTMKTLNCALMALYCALPISASAAADGDACVRDVPVNVVFPNAALARNMKAEQFAARIKTSTVPIVSVAADTAPRRIVFVIDNAKSNSQAVRRIEARIVTYMVANARPDDSFALLTGRGPRKEVRSGEPRESLLKAARELEDSASGSSQSGGVLDSVHDAKKWLEPHRPGDAVVLVSMGIERAPGISFRKVADELSGAGIRLFGLQLSTPVGGFITTSISPMIGSAGLSVQSDIAANSESLDGLAAQTGGFALLENTDSWDRVYKLSEEHLELVARRVFQFYKAIGEYYIVKARVPPKGFEIELSAQAKAKLPAAMMAFPRRVEACASPGPASLAPTR